MRQSNHSAQNGLVPEPTLIVRPGALSRTGALPPVPPIRPRPTSVSIAVFGLIALFAGCAVSGTPLARAARDPIVLNPSYTEYAFDGSAPVDRVMSPEDLVAEAEKEARIQGWRPPLAGTFIIRDGDGTVRKLVVNPLSAQGVRSAGIRMEHVDWVNIRESADMPAIEHR